MKVAIGAVLHQRETVSSALRILSVHHASGSQLGLARAANLPASA